ncbi:hypothetical protein GJ496_004640 [Pomphorhynchus laevis]|nr:hypothetical protein GJ496_004640 [Pomphorhynchus laevis]
MVKDFFICENDEHFNQLGSNVYQICCVEKLDNISDDSTPSNDEESQFKDVFNRIMEDCYMYKRNTTVLLYDDNNEDKLSLCQTMLNIATSSLRNANDVFRFRLLLLRANLIINTMGCCNLPDGRKSSQFGKCIRFYLKRQGDSLHVGRSCVDAFLLDTSPLLNNISSMRCFTILYVLMFGKSEMQLDQAFGLSTVLRYLSNTGVTSLKTYYENMYRKFVVSLQTHSFTSSEVYAILAVIASIIHLVCKPCRNKDTDWWISNLLGVNTEDLLVVLRVNNSSSDANYGALARALYNRLFKWILSKIKDVLSDANTNSNVCPNAISIIDVPAHSSTSHNNINSYFLSILGKNIRQTYLQTRHVTYLDDIIFNRSSSNVDSEFDEVNVAGNAEISPESTFRDRFTEWIQNTKIDDTDSDHYNEILLALMEINVTQILNKSNNSILRKMWSMNENELKKKRTILDEYLSVKHELARIIDRSDDVIHMVCSKDFVIYPEIVSLIKLIKSTGVYSALSFTQFVQRYGMLHKSEDKIDQNNDELAKSIVTSLQINEHCQYRKRYILFTNLRVPYLLETQRIMSITPMIILLQKAIKNWSGRNFFIRDKAARKIARSYRIMSIQRYFEDLFERNVQAINEETKIIERPQLPATLRLENVNLTNIFCRWYDIVKKAPLTESIHELMKTKWIAARMLSSRTTFATNGLMSLWVGNYLSKPAFNPLTYDIFKRKIDELKVEDLFSSVYFSTFATKMNCRGNTDRRAIVLTDKFVYKLDPEKHFNIRKKPIPYWEFTGASVTDGDDQLVVLHHNSQDLVFNMECEVDRVAEIIGIFVNLCQRNNHGKISVNVKNIINVRFEKFQYLVTVMNGPKLTFKREGNIMVITSPQPARNPLNDKS